MPNAPRERSFEELVAEAADVSVEGWDFSWLDGRATEQRPSWGYQQLIKTRLAQAQAALDIETGGGEVLAGAVLFPPAMVATESWPPNVTRATRLLHPLGAVVVSNDGPLLPFTDAAFDLVISRHPVIVHWAEIARVLQPGGTYLSQQVGHRSVIELTEHFLGPQPDTDVSPRHPECAREAAERAGLNVVDLRSEMLRMEFFDVGAVVYFLRKVIWIVPGFSVEQCRDRLRTLHDRIQADGSIVAHSTRFLIEAEKVEGAPSSP